MAQLDRHRQFWDILKTKINEVSGRLVKSVEELHLAVDLDGDDPDADIVT